MSFAAFVNHWWNLPFLVMLGLCGVFFLLQIVGMFGGGGDHDVSPDGDADVDSDLDADADHDVDADADADEAGGASAAWHEVLGFLGVGRVPFMVVWVTLFLFGGFSGLFLNRVLFVRSAGDYRGWWFVLVALASLLVGLVGVRFFSRLAARFVDVGGRGAVAKHELAGKIGVVASPVLDAKYGEIRLNDERGNELLVHACVRAGEPALARGAKVVLVSFDPEKEMFWAAACPEVEVGEEKEKRS